MCETSEQNGLTKTQYLCRRLLLCANYKNKTRSTMVRLILTALFLTFGIPVVDAAWDRRELANDDAKLAQYLAEEKEGVEIMNLCDSDNACADGLQCTATGGIGKRCIPADCIAEEVAIFQETFDLPSYIDMIFDQAGTSRDEIIRSRVASFLPFNDNGQSFRDIQTAVRAALDDNPEPTDELKEILRFCTGQDDDSTESTGKQSNITESTLPYYSGLKCEYGILVDFSCVCFETMQRACVGAVDIGADLGLLVGLFVNAPDVSEEPCSAIMADADVAVGAGVGLGLGVSSNGGFFLEIELLVGVGAGAGLSFCSLNSG